MSDHHAPAGDEKPSLLSNVLAIIGLIILIIIIVWGLVHLAELSGSWFSSLFPKSTPALEITTPSDAASGAPVTISWNYSSTAAGTYGFIYQCGHDVQFGTIDAATHTATAIPCGTAAAITPSSDSVQLLPLLSGTSSASVDYSVIFTPSSGAAVEGNGTIMIHPASATVQTAPTNASAASTQPPVKSTATAVRTYGPADLAVRITSEYVDRYGNGTVTFNISNIGGSTSRGYYFTAQLPTANGTPYTSGIQAPLAPGSYIVNTLHFSPAMSGAFSVTIEAADANQNNDYDTVWINAPVTNYNYGGSYNYGGGVYSPYTQYQSYPYTY